MHVLVGVTGGIAAYKSLPVIRELKHLGHEVRVVATESSFHFVGRDSLAALSENPVEIDLFAESHEVKHIELAQWADLIVVAPATAAFLSRLAVGSAWDLLDNVALAASSPILVAPAMHTEMWQNPATVANVELLKSRGIAVLEPESGWLSSGDYGSGRLPEPEVIVSAALRLVTEQDLAGIDAVVTVGGTQEELDPVRYIGNKSSGRTGLAIANELQCRGANVLLIGCNLGADEVANFTSLPVTTAAELEQALRTVSPRVLVMAAAVSDFTVARSTEKLSRSTEAIQLQLVPTADLLGQFTKRNPGTFCVGFTLQERGLLKQSGLRKLASKGVDLMVANDLESLAGELTHGYLLARDLELEFSCSKAALATLLVDELAKRLNVGTGA